MEKQNKQCQNCQQNFVIEPEDFGFYEKMKVPPPTWCPECRLMRRLAWRDGRTMYKSQCALCGETMFSMYAPESDYIVYCQSCWFSDKWDPMFYGRDCDFSRSFFEQFDEFLKKVPRPATNSKNSPTSPYCNNVTGCKNCYLVFGAYFSEDCLYSDPIFSKVSLDSNILLSGDHAYETVSCSRIYNTKFSYFVSDSFDSAFLFDCRGCSNCFGCVNLRNKKYYIFNQPYTKEEYQKRVVEFDLGSYQKLEALKKQFKKFYYSIPHRFALFSNVTNATGNDINNSKNCLNCFSCKDGVEDCKYIFFAGLSLRDSYDVTAAGDKSQLLYETSGSVGASKVFFSKTASHGHDIYYSEQVTNCSDIFGCTNLRNKSYCIFNKQYTKEEYFELRDKIIQQMKERPYTNSVGIKYGYGEYFPVELAPLPYNNSWVQDFFPLTKEEVAQKKYRWQDNKERNYQITIASAQLPDHIKDVPDSISKEILECTHHGECEEDCTTAFRILPEELKFYRQMNLALPRLCPNCRYKQRLQWTNRPKLWRKACQCAGKQSDNNIYPNTSIHFHGANPCPTEFETSYAPDRPEIIYCEKCYQEEFI